MGNRGYSGNHPRFSRRGDERYDAKEAYNKDLTASARLHYLENDRHDHESPAHSHCSPMHRHTDAHMRRQAKRIARRTKGDEQDIYYEMKSKKMSDERSQGRNEFEQEKLQEEMDRMIDERGGSPFNSNHSNPYRRAKDATGAIEVDARIIGDMKRKQDRISSRPTYVGGMFNVAGVRDMRGIMKDHKDLKENVKGHMDRDKAVYPEGMGTYYDERSGGLKQEFLNDPESFVKQEEENTDRLKRFNDTPMKMEGKGCAKSEGGSGCVVKRGDEFVILNNKKGGIFQSGFKSRAAAEKSLAGYHANK